MDELPGLIVALLLIFFIARYYLSSRTPTDVDPLANGPLRGITSEMISTVSSTFPHIPPSSIVFSLSKTRSAQATSEIILEMGSLPIPPPTFPTHPYLTSASQSQPFQPTQQTTLQPPSTFTSSTQPSLIDRYNLSHRIRSLEKGKFKESIQHDNVGGVGGGFVDDSTMKWEKTVEEREERLRARKEKMVLDARRRLLDKQATRNVE